MIQERLGHASIRTTLDVYGHLFEGLDKAAADSLDAAIAKAGVGLSWGLSRIWPTGSEANRAETPA